MKKRRKKEKRRKIKKAVKQERKKIEEREIDYFSLLEEKQAIEDLLASVEDEYREANISEEAYQELKEKNLKRLERIEKLLKKAKKVRETLDNVSVPPSKEVQTKPTEKPEIEDTVSKVVKKVFSEEVEPFLQKTTTELEKLKVLITTVKEGLGATNERLQVVSEQMAELRTLSHQREARVREAEVKLEKLSDIVSGLELKKLKKEFEKRDRTLGEHAMKIEKLEKLTELMRKEQRRLGNILEEIGSIENVLRVLKEVDSKLKTISKKGEHIEKISGKVEKLYVELSKRLEEFSSYKDEQMKLKDLVEELMRSVEELSMKITEYAKREEVESLREMLERRIESLRAETEELIPEPIKELRKEKESIEELLATLEREYEEGTISEKEYTEAKERNLERLRIVEEKIRKTWEEIKGAKKRREEKKPLRKKEEGLVAELEELFRKGMISREAYEKSKKILLGR